MVREILARTSEMFKITFKEVDSNNYDDAQIRFHWYESTGGKVSFAYYPSIDRTDIMVALNRPEQFDDPSYFEISPQGTMTWTTRHELGHALGLKHPFEHFVISGELDEALYPEYYYANTIFTNMAYAEFFSKNKDKYAEGNPKYASTAFSLVTKYDFKLNDQIQVSPDDPPKKKVKMPDGATYPEGSSEYDKVVKEYGLEKPGITAAMRTKLAVHMMKVEIHLAIVD